MKLLGIDPSSTKTGYAVMNGPTRLIDVGLLKPVSAKDKPWLRARDMAVEVDKIIVAKKIQRVVIEMPSGKVARRKKAAMGGAGLSVYGVAAGVIWWECYKIMSGCVDAIQENVWTRGVPKQRTKDGRPGRQDAIAAIYANAYDPADDPGADVSDAIGICDWWYQEKLFHNTVTVA